MCDDGKIPVKQFWWLVSKHISSISQKCWKNYVNLVSWKYPEQEQKLFQVKGLVFTFTIILISYIDPSRVNVLFTVFARCLEASINLDFIHSSFTLLIATFCKLGTIIVN